MNKYTRVAALLALTAFMAAWLTGCRGGRVQHDVPPASNSPAPAAEVDISFNARDMDVGYDEAGATKITLGSSIGITGDGTEVSGSVLTISQSGTYILTGTLADGQIVVDTDTADEVRLVLSGVALACADSAALVVRRAAKVYLTLAEGTQNVLSSDKAYGAEAIAEGLDGVICSRADLTVNGDGALRVTGAYTHGIVSRGSLVITGGSLDITANGLGLYGKDCVKVKSGSFVLHTQGGAVQSGNAKEAGLGYIYIQSGRFDITAAADGIQAQSALRIDSGELCVQAGGGSGASMQENAGARGLKAGGTLEIYGGNINLDSVDDSLHTDGDLYISDGTLSAASGRRGLHANGTVYIRGGAVTVTRSSNAIQGNAIAIEGGTITLTAMDDGLHATGGSEISAGSADYSAAAQRFIRISGGSISIDACGDGIDSNGDVHITGGTTFVSGPEEARDGALDYGGYAVVTGGTFVAVGSAAMVQGFTDGSTQCSLLHVLPSAVPAGSTDTLLDAAGQALVSFTPGKSWQAVVISTPSLTVGGRYTLTAAGYSVPITLTSAVMSGSPAAA